MVNMSDQRVWDILNELLAAMENGPAACLTHAGVFLSAVGTQEYDTVLQIVEEDSRQAAELAELLIRVGGTPSPSPGAPDVDAAQLHYLNLHFVLSKITAFKRDFASRCESVLDALADSPAAQQSVARIAAIQREHVSRLEQLISPAHATAAPKA